jgi:hypothetical protein
MRIISAHVSPQRWNPSQSAADHGTPNLETLMIYVNLARQLTTVAEGSKLRLSARHVAQHKARAEAANGRLGSI